MPITEITKENYEELVQRSEKPVLLDFWAPWCGPCRMIAPFVDEIAKENESILVGKVNVDEQIQIATHFGIASIPTLILLSDGQVAATVVGYRTKADILKLLGI